MKDFPDASIGMACGNSPGGSRLRGQHRTGVLIKRFDVYVYAIRNCDELDGQGDGRDDYKGNPVIMRTATSINVASLAKSIGNAG